MRFAAVTGVMALVAIGAGLWGWLSVRFRVEGDDFVVVTGLLRKRTRSVPLTRLQAVDVVRPLVTRVFRLSEVRVEAAGGEQTGIALRFLGRDAGEDLRNELLSLASGKPSQAPHMPERHFWRVRYGSLLGSLLMRIPVMATFLLFVGSLVFMVFAGEPALLAVTVPALLALIRDVVAPAVMYAGFRVAVSPEGLRLRYGLLETRTQTLPPGRVQAVGIVEPALWRSLGWARLEITVAGYAGERQALSSVLLPVAPRAVCMGLVRLLFMERDVDAIPLVPPASVALSLDHPHGAGADGVLFVSRRGWPSRRTDVIPHVRAQSVRLTVNPVQRVLGLATVHVDAPSGPIRVRAADRAAGEARAMVESLGRLAADPSNAP
ncbi:PH domain-containing protein [Actinomadura atramentaria]|uniref:PH domain-containing protein n=1 Tax=Actinomadura atramentaria TaxID=1990 RepID=UPI001F0A16C0|nr:PH domain-containing protein [Actinomadura atramentaria]